MSKQTLRRLTAVLDRSLYFLIACALVVVSMLTLERWLPPALLSPLASLSQAAGLRQNQRGTWTTYTVENTSHRGDQVTIVTKDTAAGSWEVPVDFVSEEEADAALASGYVMFENDPTIYRYRGFPWTGSIRICPSLRQNISASVPVYAVEIGLTSNYVRAIAIDREGKVWFVLNLEHPCGGGGVSAFNGASWTTYNTSNSGLASSWVYAIAIDEEGNKWFGTSNGVSKFDGVTWTTYNTSNSGLAHNSVYAIAIDEEGNKWFGTNSPWAFGTSNGVSKFDGTTWTTYNTSNSELADDSVPAIGIDKERNKWFGTKRGGVSKFDGVTWTTYNTSNSRLASNYVQSIAIDSADVKWFGGCAPAYEWSPNSFDCYTAVVSRFDGTNWTSYIAGESGLVGREVNAIAIDREGKKWFGTDAGVSVFDGSAWTTYNTANSGLVSDHIKALAIDEAGNLWIGTDAGVSKFHEEAETLEYSIYLPIVLKNLSQ